MLLVSTIQEEASYSEEIHCNPEYHRFLIGRGGANIRKVREETRARIVFPSARDDDQTLITVIGTKTAVNEAKVKLEALIKELVRNFVIGWQVCETGLGRGGRMGAGVGEGVSVSNGVVNHCRNPNALNNAMSRWGFWSVLRVSGQMGYDLSF